ncbi:hypothetical protein AAEX28_10755 [Lentisphaerota bacterium WC36G]|nr:hypothetical protein LJT99_13600 [Lentisphaerae bacterium WC36]
MKAKEIEVKKVLSMGKCYDFFSRYGYFIYEESEDLLVLKKSGTAWAFSLKHFPLELSFKIIGKSTTVSLKYDTWVLFDTGDLREELHRIYNIIEAHSQKLIAK